MSSLRWTACAAIFLTTLTAHAAGTCVLLFEREGTPFWKSVHTIERRLGSQADVKFVYDAIPADIAECARSGATSLTLVSHSADYGKDAATLVYFPRLRGAERETHLAKEEALLKKKIGTLAPLFKPCGYSTVDHQDGCIESKETRQYRAFREKLNRLTHLKETDPVYTAPLPILPHALNALGTNSRLKLIRIAACEPAKLGKRYPILDDLAKSGTTQVEYAPTSSFWSAVYGKTVTNLNPRWLAQGLALQH